MLRDVGLLGSFAGLRIVESPALYDIVEDWSQVRSPGRARRRRAKHPQRIIFRHVPKPDAYRIGNEIHMHPVTLRKFREVLAAQHPEPTPFSFDHSRPW